LQRGADAILPVAGPQTIDTVKEIQAYGSSCIVVGVDTAQELDTNTNGRSVYKDVNGDANVIKFSATKNIAGITSQILSLSYAGLPDDSTFTSGDPKVGSYGYLTVGNTENDGIAPSEYSYRYIEEFITSVTDGVTPPDDAIYTWILEELSGLPPPDGTQESYFDWLSQPENMVFKI
jgi:basic membrane lipoprotein Med (substrate-binding protein (PBP1-ABC) superfamily)